MVVSVPLRRVHTSSAGPLRIGATERANVAKLLAEQLDATWLPEHVRIVPSSQQTEQASAQQQQQQ